MVLFRSIVSWETQSGVSLKFSQDQSWRMSLVPDPRSFQTKSPRSPARILDQGECSLKHVVFEPWMVSLVSRSSLGDTHRWHAGRPPTASAPESSNEYSKGSCFCFKQVAGLGY
jgi:hypothetical protein